MFKELPAPRILLADDDADCRFALAALLEAEGFAVAAVPDGARAVERQLEWRAQVLITDLFMPERDGLETLKEFRARFPEVNVIVLSGGGSRNLRADYLLAAREAGAHAVFRKPVEIAHLLRVLRPAPTNLAS